MAKLKLYALAINAFVSALLTGSVAAQTPEETAAWRRATQTNTSEAYDGFLRAHPDSRYAGEAFDRMVQFRLNEKRPEFFREAPQPRGPAVDANLY